MSDSANITIKTTITDAELKMVKAMHAKNMSKSAMMRKLNKEGWKNAKVAEALTIVFGTYVRPQFVYNVIKASK
jgi:TnpA family transposase